MGSEMCIRDRNISDKNMSERLCYNRGCGKNFLPKNNNDGELFDFVYLVSCNILIFSEACTFHPGAPYFHDAYKGWSCCQMKSTDFTTFLNTPVRKNLRVAVLF